MCSPVSRRALGERNAIIVRGCGYRGFTFVSPWEATFGASHKPVPGQCPGCPTDRQANENSVARFTALSPVVPFSSSRRRAFSASFAIVLDRVLALFSTTAPIRQELSDGAYYCLIHIVRCPRPACSRSKAATRASTSSQVL